MYNNKILTTHNCERERESLIESVCAQTTPFRDSLMWWWPESLHGVWNSGTVWKAPPKRKFHTKEENCGKFQIPCSEFHQWLINFNSSHPGLYCTRPSKLFEFPDIENYRTCSFRCSLIHEDPDGRSTLPSDTWKSTHRTPTVHIPIRDTSAPCSSLTGPTNAYSHIQWIHHWRDCVIYRDGDNITVVILGNSLATHSTVIKVMDSRHPKNM
jgi:hypothetical protein